MLFSSSFSNIRLKLQEKRQIKSRDDNSYATSQKLSYKLKSLKLLLLEIEKEKIKRTKENKETYLGWNKNVILKKYQILQETERKV